jgi:hypothetical protein
MCLNLSRRLAGAREPSYFLADLKDFYTNLSSENAIVAILIIIASYIKVGLIAT